MFKKIMGNIFQNDGQRFLKIRAMIFQTMGNVFVKGSGDYKQTKKEPQGKIPGALYVPKRQKA